MSFKEIMVQLDSPGPDRNRLDVAIAMARRHGAHLTGLYVMTQQRHRAEQDEHTDRMAEAEELFRGKTREAGIDAAWFPVDWNVAPAGIVEVVNYYGHAVDLLIVGQSSRDSSEKDYPRDLPERVVLGAGRPVLIVPYVGSFPRLGASVIVAWKPGRAAARAVHDALPILAAAREVRLLEIRSPGETAPPEKSPRLEIAGYLRRHGIPVKEEQLFTGTIPIADIVMNYAWENGCDLVVMGAYSNSIRGTINLGSVANHMLDHMTLPVFMAN